MTDILCRWLNEDLRLSQVVEPHNLAKIFSNGYLIGEVLHKYQVQNDFSLFTEKSTSISKLNNFTRLESSFHLMGISFDVNVAQALMQEKPGVAARLLYQLYFSLERKRRTQISGTIMEIMQPAAIVSLHKKEQEMYSTRLHQVVKRDAELKLQKITHHYEERLQQWNEKAAVALPIAAPPPQKREVKVQDLQKVKLKKANGEKVPKPPPYTSQLSLKRKPQQQKTQQAQKVQTEIAQFESNKKKLATYAFASSSNGQAFPLEVPVGGSGQELDLAGSGRKLVLKSNCRYMRDIRQRLLENAAAREQREKRLNRFLMEQLKAHEAQEEACRDEQLVKRLTRQTQLEQRLATQLLQMRRQKEVIRENRLFREQQYQQRRERDLQEALEMEAALAWQAKSKRPEEIGKELEYCKMVAEQRVQRRYSRHFAVCREISTQIIDLVTMVGEYRLLNENEIPEKQMREWKELLLHGLPFYESTDEQKPEQELPSDLVELAKQDILNNQDYDEYTNMVGEWAWPEEAGETEVPPSNNDTLGHVVVRLRNLLHQTVDLTPPPLPQFTFKACVLGKSCSGKSSCLARFAKAHEMYILSADALIEEALNAHHIGEVIEVPEKQDKVESELLASFTSPSLEFEEEGRGSEIRIPENQDKEDSELLESNTSLTSDLKPEVGSKSRKVAEQKEKEKELLASSASSKHGEPEKKSKGKDLKVKEQQSKEDTKLLAPSTTPKLEENEGNEIKQDKESQELLATSTTPKAGLESEEGCAGTESRLSGRAVHGAIVENELKKGYAIPNELLVDVIGEAIRQIPAQSSWILDGFPSDVTQAELLRKALGGAVEKTAVHDRTQLVVDPCPPKTPPPAPLVLDLAVLLDIPDECVARRAYSHADAAAEASFHPTDVTLYQAQIPHRITFFHKTWPKLEKWLDKKLRILVRVDADVDEEELYRRVESVLQEAMQQKDDALSIPMVEYVVHDSDKTPDSLSTTPSSAEPLSELTDKVAESTEPTPTLREEKTSSLKSASKISKDSPRDLPEKTPTSGIIEYHVANVKGTPESDISFLDPSGLYVHKTLPADVPESLSSHWDAMCDMYVNNIKAVMQHLRSQRAEIDRRFYDMRGDYGHYLRRPDLKQEFVSEWQKYFNSSMWDSTRYDEQTKAELHLRLDELCERLWDISETRKEHGDRERDALMHGGRLEDQAVVLVNHHAILMQVELDRFQATLHILRIYYLGMRSDILPDLSPDILKVALQEAVEIRDKQSDNARKGQDQTEAIKQPNEKFFSDHEETVSAISNLVLAEASKWEKNEDDADKEDKGAANKKKKAKPAPKKKKGDTPPPAASDESSEKSSEDEVKTRIHKEYDVALKHEENASKVRMALVRGHSVALVSLLQRRAQETTGRMQQWLEEHYQAEMKSIDQLSEVVRYHIESAEHLKNEMVLRGTEFFLMDVCHVENPAALRIIQLECLYQGFRLVSQSGVMPSSGLYKVLGEITSVHIENSKVPYIESLLRDESEHIDWRRLLLSAALPWPSPSVPQLLSVLEGFKAVDSDLTGYVSEDQYLQVELWFSDGTEDAQGDSLEMPSSKRLAELRKFFFKLFADHSSLPSRLHYETMLRYFAADPDPREGFIRALCLVLGKQVKSPSQDQLVQSMPSMEEEEEEEEEEEVETSELSADNQEEKALDVSSTSSAEQEVSIPALLAVIGRKVPETSQSQEELVQIFAELNYGWEDSVPFSVLRQHPAFQALMERSTQHQLIDIHNLLLCCLDGTDEEEKDESDSVTSL